VSTSRSTSLPGRASPRSSEPNKRTLRAPSSADRSRDLVAPQAQRVQVKHVRGSVNRTTTLPLRSGSFLLRLKPAAGRHEVGREGLATVARSAGQVRSRRVPTCSQLGEFQCTSAHSSDLKSPENTGEDALGRHCKSAGPAFEGSNPSPATPSIYGFLVPRHSFSADASCCAGVIVVAPRSS
jgi:hypothetical protein